MKIESILHEAEGKFKSELTRNATSKSGRTYYKGMPVECDFSPVGGLYNKFKVTMHNGDELSVKYENAYSLLIGFKPAPSITQLEKAMSTSGMCTTPLGAKTDMDSVGPNNEPSWMLVLGLV